MVLIFNGGSLTNKLQNIQKFPEFIFCQTKNLVKRGFDCFRSQSMDFYDEV